MAMARTCDGLGQKGRNMKSSAKLQLFAEGEGDGAVGNELTGNATGATGEKPQSAQELLSFDDFLLQDGNQAEFDRRVQKAIQTAVLNAQKKWETLTDDRVSEAEKLAQMTGEQKEKYRADKAERELADLKRQIALGEMAKTARKMLSDEEISIPDDLVMNLVSDDAEKTKSSVEAFAKVFKDAVQVAVKSALRGDVPKATENPAPITKEQILAIKDTAERRRLMAENPELFIRRR